MRVDVHDFPDPEVGNAVPYGVYYLAANEGFVVVGDDGDTAEFAVVSIRRWWEQVGSVAYPDATRLLITADAGGSNGYRCQGVAGGGDPLVAGGEGPLMHRRQGEPARPCLLAGVLISTRCAASPAAQAVREATRATSARSRASSVGTKGAGPGVLPAPRHRDRPPPE